MTSTNCATEIYSELNYKQQREDNFRKTQELYQNLLNQYTTNYQDYLRTQSQPDNPESQNLKDQSNFEKKPIIKSLNEKLIQIETEILENNKKVQLNLQEQQRQLKKQEILKKRLNKEIDQLETLLQNSKDKTITSKQGAIEIREQWQTLTYWYYFLIFINFVFFIALVYGFMNMETEKMDSPGQIYNNVRNSITSSNNTNTNRKNNKGSNNTNKRN